MFKVDEVTFFSSHRLQINTARIWKPGLKGFEMQDGVLWSLLPTRYGKNSLMQNTTESGLIEIRYILSFKSCGIVSC